MIKLRVFISVLTLMSSIAGIAGQQNVPKNLPYPNSPTVTALEAVKHVYYVNQFYAFNEFPVENQIKGMNIVVNKDRWGRVYTQAVERHINTTYSLDHAIKKQEIAIWRNGKHKSMGMLITDYSDDAKNRSYQIWVPTLRKVRRFAQPIMKDSWGGTDFTWGDVSLRKPFHETHEILAQTTFESCLDAIKIPEDKRNKWTANIPGPSCHPQGRPVYKLKSTPQYDADYDYRISYVDAQNFADYRIEYYKKGNVFKVIDKDWHSLDIDGDPRGAYWSYWYGRNYETGHESLALLLWDGMKYDSQGDEKFWSSATLRKLHR